MKKKLIFLLAMAMLLCCLSLCACSQGDSPIEAIVVTDMPVTDYYLGDAFILNNATLTAYYENGKVATVKIVPSMISAFDSQALGEQYLTVMYGGVATYVKVNVSLPPVQFVEVAPGSYKKTYVQGQTLDVNDMNLIVTYTNGYVTTVPITADMVQGFDSSMPGENQVAIVYGDNSANCYLTVVSRSISNISILAPDKMSYVVGDELDFAGAKLFVSYNNNTQSYIDIDENMLADEHFKVYISGVETRTFTIDAIKGRNGGEITEQQRRLFYENGARVYVTVSYYDHSVDFIVTLNDVKAKSGDDAIKWIREIKDQPRNSAEPDLSDAEIEVAYNNGHVARFALTDPKVTIDWKGFDIGTNGTYPIVVKCEGAAIGCDVRVVEPVETELEISTNGAEYYQDGPAIDLVDWTYKIKLSNGRYRALTVEGAVEAHFARDEHGDLIDNGLFAHPISEYDFTTTSAGEKTYQFRYRNVGGTIVLNTSVTVTVHARLIVGLDDFVAPTKTVYLQNEPVSVVGGSFRPVYNDGTNGDAVEITPEMLGSVTDHTAEVGERTVAIEYTDDRYAGRATAQYVITVVERAESIAYNAGASINFKTDYILGERFLSDDLVVVVTYVSGRSSTFTEFDDAEEWTFVCDRFDGEGRFTAVGNIDVRLYYGDVTGGYDNVLFTVIPVTVTNDVTELFFIDGFVDFGKVVEGRALELPAEPIVRAVRENGSADQVVVTADMTDYSAVNYALGERTVTVSYEGHACSAPVMVIPRSILGITVAIEPDKLAYTIADDAWDLAGLRIKADYNSGTSLYLEGNDASYVESDAEYDYYALTVSGRSLRFRLNKWNGTLAATELSKKIDLSVSVYDLTTSDAVDTLETTYAGLDLSDVVVSEIVDGAGYSVNLFKDIVEELIFGTDADGDGAVIYLYESDEFVWPEHSYVKVSYRGGAEENVYLDGRSDYYVEGYNAYSAGLQSITLGFLQKECAVTVNVTAKVLKEVIVSPLFVTVTEGMPISSDLIGIKLHFVKGDSGGTEYSPIYYVDVEYGNVTCTYDNTAPVVFDNDSGFVEQIHTVYYGDKHASFTLRINRKRATKLTMQTMPRTTYTEGETEIDLDGGKVLVTYNNGTGEQLDLSSARVSVSPIAIDGSEIEYGQNDRQQKITVSFRDDNNIEVSTAYYVNVKDRKYLSVEYESDPLDDTYLIVYGSDESYRPGFTVYGYALLSGTVGRTILATGDNIGEKADFELYYLTQEGARLDVWPTQVGVYTLVITYVGDDYNNALLENNRLINIRKKELSVLAINKTVTYGDAYDAGESGYAWTVSDGVAEGNAALECGDVMSGIASVSFEVRDPVDHSLINFFTTGSGRTVYASTSVGSVVVGDYELKPILSSSLSANYEFVALVSATLTIQKKDIVIQAAPMSKTYGDPEPTYNQYSVFDTGSVLIGTNGVINLDGGNYVDSMSTYYLSRVAGGDNENVGNDYVINRGADAYIANYNLVEYHSANLTINKKAIVISGAQVGERKYGQAVPDGSEYRYVLKTGSSMGGGDSFAALIEDATLTTEVYLGAVSTGHSVLPATADHGTYTVKTALSDGFDNYAVTIEDFDFVIDRTAINVYTYSKLVEYVDFVEGIAYDDGVDVGKVLSGVYSNINSEGSNNYSIVYPDYYDIAVEPAFTVIKESGTDVGRYELRIPQADIDACVNFVVTVIGDFGGIYEEYQDYYSLPDISVAEKNGSYMIIEPAMFDYEMDSDEVYARKDIRINPVRPALSAATATKADASTVDVSGDVYDAFEFSLTNKTPERANRGYYTADVYDVAAYYNYFYNTASRNYLPVTLLKYFTPDFVDAVYVYILTGDDTYRVSLELEPFEYEITPKEISISVNNVTTGYTGENIPITTNDYSGTLCAGDEGALSLGYVIEVVYYGVSESRETDAVKQAGEYTVAISGISNTDYELIGNVPCVFTVTPIELTVRIATADGNGLVYATYNGEPVKTGNMNWQTVSGGSAENGYFSAANGTYLVVNNVPGLTRTALNSLSIRPVNDQGNVPTNANATDEHDNVIPYEYAWSVNEEFVNMSVVFERDYGFVIRPREVTLQYLTQGKTNFKEYDGRAPEIRNKERIIINNDVNADKIDVNNLRFSFTRDMDVVPAALRDMITEEDLTSAGRFSISVSYYKNVNNVDTKINNYSFRLTGDDRYYTIRRLHVQLDLNAVSGIEAVYLSKQYDSVAPDTTITDIPKKQSFVISDEVNIELEPKYFTSAHTFGVTSSWSAYNSADGNGIGYYAYDFKTYCISGGNKVYFADVIKDNGYDLLSWDYTYSITSVSSFDTNSCDGVYRIIPKDVSLYVDGAVDSALLDDGSANPTIYYLYTRTYDGSTVSSDAASAVLNTYTVLDDEGNTLSTEDLATLKFHRENIALPAGSVTNAGSYFAASISTLVAANPNFRITNNPIAYQIGRMTVDLTLRFFNASGDPEMVYGTVIDKAGSGMTYNTAACFDFYDVDAFLDSFAAGSRPTGEMTSIAYWITSNQAQVDKFVITNAIYSLNKGGREYVLDGTSIFDAGVYTVGARGIVSQNFAFVIHGATFTINQKEINLTGAERDYFDKENLDIDYYIDGSVNAMVERNIVTAVVNAFTDATPTASDAGTYVAGDPDYGTYYISVSRTYIDSVMRNYGNYKLVISEITPDNYDANKIYIALTINKLNVTAALKGANGSDLSINYGHILTSNEYQFVMTGMPTLSPDADYDYSTELNKQRLVNTMIVSAVDGYADTPILNMNALITYIAGRSARDNAYVDTYLSDYIVGSTELTNYSITFADLSYSVSRIILNFVIHKSGSFRILLDEINGNMEYSESGTSRFNYYFTIDNLTDIIGYDQSEDDTMQKILSKVWSNGSAPADFADTITYSIYNPAGGEVTAGTNKFVVTGDWFHSLNYTLHCEPVDVEVYRKVVYVGNGVKGDLPYTGISLRGAQGDYVTSILGDLSMLVNMYYDAMPTGSESEWIDIKDYDSTVYEGADYTRNWTVNFVGAPPASIQVGDVVKLTLSFREEFFEGDSARSNEILTEEFLVKVYALPDTSDPTEPVRDRTVKDRTTTDFVYNGGTISAFNDVKDGNYSYYATNAKSVMTPFEGKFDLVSMDVVLGKKNATDFSFETVLFDDGTSKLLLGFKGGSTYGYYAKLIASGNTYQSELMHEYAYIDEAGEEQTRSVLFDVNMFDGRRHTVVAYIDKLGYVGESTAISGGYSMKRYYTVTFEIDGKFMYTLAYEGGNVTVINNEYAYTNYIDFSADSKAGFILNETTAYLYRMTLKTTGIPLSSNGSVIDVRISPYDDEAVIYAETGCDVMDMLDYYVVNGNDGYEGKVSYDVTCRNASTGAIVKDPDTGDNLTVIENAGLYIITVTVRVNGIQVLNARRFYLNVIDVRESVVTITDSLEGNMTIYPDSPTILAGGSGRSAFLASQAASIDYTRLVFDFVDDSDWASGYKSYTTILLKTSNNTKLDLNTYNPDTDQNYTGISIAIKQTGTSESHSFETIIFARVGSLLWKETYSGINWEGSNNVLTARYDYVNGVIDIELKRGNSTLFFEKIRVGALAQLGSPISTENVKTIVGTGAGKRGYCGLQLFRSTLTIHELRITEPKPDAYELVGSSGNFVDPESFTGTAFVSDSYGVPAPTANRSLYLKFKAELYGAVGKNVYIMFVNNTPYLKDYSDPDNNYDGDTVTAERGAVLLLTETAVQMFVYKYQIEFRRQNICNVNLLDGNEHTIIIRITDSVFNTSDDQSGALALYGLNVDGYLIDVSIDGEAYAGFVPISNDLHEAIAMTSGTGSDLEYGAENKDQYFISETHYIGMVGNNVDITIKELMLF